MKQQLLIVVRNQPLVSYNYVKLCNYIDTLNNNIVILSSKLCVF